MEQRCYESQILPSQFHAFSQEYAYRRTAEAFPGNYLDVPGGTSGSPGAMSGGTFGSSFAACGRRHDTTMFTDPMSGRCTYWPDSKLL